MSNHLPIITITRLSPNFDDSFAFSRIPREEWDIKLQDAGCIHDELPSKTYKENKIISVSPAETKAFYYKLTSIVVDLSKKFVTKNQCMCGWDKMPKH